LGSLCEEKSFFFNLFFWTSELHISQAFREHQARLILTLYELVVKFCSKHVLYKYNIAIYFYVKLAKDDYFSFHAKFEMWQEQEPLEGNANGLVRKQR
jgi:hypothetical protein